MEARFHDTFEGSDSNTFCFSDLISTIRYIVSGFQDAHFKTPRRFTVRCQDAPDAQDDLYNIVEVPGVQDMQFSWNYHRNHHMHEPTVRALQSITDLVLGASLAIPWRVLLYCKQGTSRSASMAAGWLTCRHMRACRSCTYVDAQRCLREALSDYHYDIMIMIQNLSLR